MKEFWKKIFADVMNIFGWFMFEKNTCKREKKYFFIILSKHDYYSQKFH